MNLPLILRPEAQAEFDEAYDWYESERPGLGEAFADRIHEVFNRITNLPRLHAKVFGDVRKAVVKRFPYCVFYREEQTCIRVLSVFHTSRDPRGWQDRS